MYAFRNSGYANSHPGRTTAARALPGAPHKMLPMATRVSTAGSQATRSLPSSRDHVKRDWRAVLMGGSNVLDRFALVTSSSACRTGFEQPYSRPVRTEAPWHLGASKKQPTPRRNPAKSVASLPLPPRPPVKRSRTSAAQFGQEPRDQGEAGYVVPSYVSMCRRTFSGTGRDDWVALSKFT
jgi:hypothetical protein